MRASTEEQRLTNGVQQETIEEWCAKEGQTLLATFADTISTREPFEKRPALGELLAYVHQHDVDRVVYVRRDRLTRDPVQGFVIEKILRDDGCEVFDISGVGNGDSPADEMIRGIMDVVNKYERSITSLRTKAILAAKKARGERIGGVPYGFTSVNGKLQVDEDEQHIIEVVAELRHDMELTYAEIIALLDVRGLTNRRGNKFSKSSLCEMVKTHEKRMEVAVNGIFTL
tara:strand:+ start:630 stop:1316 length:687 start_codon:yes stop_codon:yes gene_type:complete